MVLIILGNNTYPYRCHPNSSPKLVTTKKIKPEKISDTLGISSPPPVKFSELDWSLVVPNATNKGRSPTFTRYVFVFFIGHYYYVVCIYKYTYTWCMCDHSKWLHTYVWYKLYMQVVYVYARILRLEFHADINLLCWKDA